MHVTKRVAWLLVAVSLILVACGTSPETTDPADEQENFSVATASALPEGGGLASGESPPTAGVAEAPSVDDGTMAANVPQLGNEAVTTDSGLQYEDTAAGSGDLAQDGDLVSVHYTGYLPNGTIFDSSIERGEPFGFTLGTGGVIQGWDEGVAGMAVGGKRILVIPPELGYGSTARGDIPADSTLIFEVELMEIEKLPDPVAVDSYERTESGLEYAILEEGDGEAAASGDLVTIQYNAWLENGTLFDSSRQAPSPPQFVLGTAGLEGLDQGIVGMLVGESRQLRIPPELAFGDEGAGGTIPPGATLIFEIVLEAIEVLPKPEEVDAYISTAEGLEYVVLQEGDGETVAAGDTVTVHYDGWLQNGILFDSSRQADRPFTFTQGEGGVIEGWEIGVIGMKVGETRQFRIPPDLAYGEQQVGNLIPPNSTLIFQVEVLEIGQ